MSGHYAPPARNSREFVHGLADAGADMSRVSISKSYARLVGLESCFQTKHKLTSRERKVGDLMHLEEKRRREEEQRDKTESAEKEKVVLEAQAAEMDRLKREKGLAHRILRRLRLGGEETA